MKYKFDEAKHRHYIVDAEGKFKMVPGVTTISGMIDDGKSNALMGWAAKMVWEKFVEEFEPNMDGTYPTVNKWELSYENFDAIGSYLKKNYKVSRDAAADLGTRVHSLCELFWDEPWIEPSADERPAFNAFVKWTENCRIKALATEINVYSEAHRYAGILDLLAEIDGKTYLVDLKTSNRVSPGMFIQVAGYAIAYEEMTGEAILNAGILRLDKLTGIYEWTDLSADLAQAKEDFMGCLNLYQNLKSYRKTIRGGIYKGGV
jgi:hypothetical protein